MISGARPFLSLAAACILALVVTSGTRADSGPVELQQGGTVRVRSIGSVKARNAALIMSGQQGGELALEVRILPLPRSPSASGLAVSVEIDRTSMLEGHDRQNVEAEVYAYALTPDGEVAGFLAQAFEADLARTGGSGPRGFRFLGQLDLVPGTYSVHVLVRNSHTDRVGLRIASADVIGMDETDTLVLPPWVADAGEMWLHVQQAPRADGQSASRALALFDNVGIPAACPVIVAGQAVTVHVPVYRRSAEFDAGLGIELVDSSGLRDPGEWTTVGRRSIDEFGLDLVEGTFVPPLLTPGLYEWRAVLGEEDPQVSGSGRMILAGEISGNPTWPEILSGFVTPGELSRSSGSTASNEFSSRMGPGRMRSMFVAALGALAQGRQDEARSTLIELETSVVWGDDYDRALRRLIRIETRIMRRLAETDVEGLFPLLSLYESLYRYYSERQLFQLQTHARMLIFAMIDGYVSRGGSTQMAAHFLSDFAARVGDVPLAEEIFQRALKIERHDPATLFGLAAIAELRGNYLEAIGFLDRVPDLRGAGPENPDPAQRQALLRQAVCLRRLGEPERARTILQRLTRSDLKDWIDGVAHQELAGLHIDDDRLDDAERVLKTGIERSPDDEKQYLLLAFIYELKRDPWEARSVLARLRARRISDRDSTRRLYSQLYIQAFEKNARLLREGVQARLPRLAAIVEREDSG